MQSRIIATVRRIVIDGCGLPIGNLSSQLFSNVYMNVFDQYVKRKLKCHHYGRYVDDAYIVSDDREYLNNLISEITSFLEEELGLKVHPYKTCRDRCLESISRCFWESRRNLIRTLNSDL